MVEQRTMTEKRIGSAYVREFGLGMVGYCVSLLLIILLVDFEKAGWWKFAVALVPVVPALLAVAAVARHLNRTDEMQRSIQVSGMAVGFGVAMITAMTIGFLSMAGLDLPYAGPWIIYAFGMMGWAVSSGRASSGMGQC